MIMNKGEEYKNRRKRNENKQKDNIMETGVLTILPWK
jgi:hypothetical protein